MGGTDAGKTYGQQTEHRPPGTSIDCGALAGWNKRTPWRTADLEKISPELGGRSLEHIPPNDAEFQQGTIAQTEQDALCQEHHS